MHPQFALHQATFDATWSGDTSQREADELAWVNVGEDCGNARDCLVVKVIDQQVDRSRDPLRKGEYPHTCGNESFGRARAKENAYTEKPCGALGSKEMCISVVSRGHETNSPKALKISGGSTPCQENSPKGGSFP
jgi:hypothetical protein